MRTFCAALLLGMAGMGWGQHQPDGVETVRKICAVLEPSTRAKTEACQSFVSQPKPLKCGKWEHVDAPSQWCGDVYGPYGGNAHNQCYPPKCAPDMHSLTEKEWQELQQRIKWLAEVVAYREAKGK